MPEMITEPIRGITPDTNTAPPGDANMEATPASTTEATADTNMGATLGTRTQPVGRTNMAPPPDRITTTARDRAAKIRRWPSSVHTEGK